MTVVAHMFRTCCLGLTVVISEQPKDINNSRGKLNGSKQRIR